MRLSPPELTTITNSAAVDIFFQLNVQINSPLRRYRHSPPFPSPFCPFLLPVESLVTPMHVYACSTESKDVQEEKTHATIPIPFHPSISSALLPHGNEHHREQGTQNSEHSFRRFHVSSFPSSSSFSSYLPWPFGKLNSCETKTHTKRTVGVTPLPFYCRLFCYTSFASKIPSVCTVLTLFSLSRGRPIRLLGVGFLQFYTYKLQ